MVSTEMEEGMAFPHARLSDLKELSFALGRCDGPLGWGPGAVRSVRLVFLLAVPATDSTQYFLLVSGLARLARAPRLVKRLHAAADACQMFEVLRQIELRTAPASDSARKAL
jgi:PTS system nitrogen regulatory IIA component